MGSEDFAQLILPTKFLNFLKSFHLKAFKWNDLRKFKNFVGKINWAKSSDPMVLLDLPSNLTNIATQRDHYLPQSIEVSGHIKNFYISIARQGYQSLNPFMANGFIKKPEFNLSYTASGGPLTFIGKIQYSDFDLEHLINNLLIRRLLIRCSRSKSEY